MTDDDTSGHGSGGASVRLASAIDDAVTRLVDGPGTCAEVAALARSEVDARLVAREAPVVGKFEGFVAELTVAGVRSFGAPSTIGMSRGLTVVYGPNGTGKTSITDALELFVQGRTSRGSGHERADGTHVPHRGAEGVRSHPEVTVQWCEERTATSTQSVTWSWQTPGPGVGATCPVPIRVVARRSLRALFEFAPGDRIAGLGAAAGLDDVIVWTAAARDLRRRAEESRSTAGEETAFVTGILADETDDLLRAIDTNPSLRDPATLAAHVTQTYVDGVDACAEALRSLAPPTAPPPAPDPRPLRDAVGRARESVAARGALAAPDRSHLVELLRKFVAIARVDETCPACEDGVFTHARRAEINDALNAETERVAACEEAERARVNLVGAVDAALAGVTHWEPWLPGHSPVPDAVQERFGDLGRGALAQAAADWNTAASGVVDALRAARGRDDLEALKSATDRLEDLAQKATTCADAYAGEHRERTEASTAVEAGNDAARTAVRVRGTEDKVAAAAIARRRAVRRATALDAAADQATQRCTTLVAAVAVDLQQQIEAWLAVLAPSSTPPIRLDVDDPTSNSTKPRLHFRVGKGRAHALGHLSDSQLESLGLAIQLARAERDEPGGLVVLDDPTDVLDEATSRKLTSDGFDRLLRAGHQILVLTHDSALVKQVWARVDEYGDAVEQHFIELTGQGAECEAFIGARDLAGILRQLKWVLDYAGVDSGVANWEAWRINAAGNLVRQAAEAALSELDQVRHSLDDGTPAPRFRSFRTLNARWNDLRRWVETRHRELAECGGRCRAGKSDIDKLLMATAALIRDGANDTSHPNATLPTVRTIRNHANEYAKLRTLFKPTTDVYADRHLTCKAAEALRHSVGCPKAQG